VPILQAGGMGSHLGECEIILPTEGSSIELRAGLHPLKRGPDEREEDYDLGFEAECVVPLLARLERQLTEQIAWVAAGPEVSTPVTLRQRFSGECALANFISDAVVARSRDFPGGPVDLAITNATAINAGIPERGPLTFQQWYAVMPFPDSIQIGRVTGRQLRAILDSNAKRVVRPEELGAIDVTRYVSRGFLHFSRGLSYDLRLGRSALGATAAAITIDGQALDDSPDRVYRVAFTTYVGNGGYGESWNGAPIGGGLPVRVEGFDMRAVEKIDTGLVLRNEVIAHLRAVRRIAPDTGARLDGRLRLV